MSDDFLTQLADVISAENAPIAADSEEWRQFCARREVHPKDAKPIAAPAASLAELREQVAVCERCPLAKQRRQTVFGEGSEHAELMFIGEGPGAEEDRQGRPFVGLAGNYVKYDIEESPGVIMTVTGRGISLESALCDFVNKISGKTLVTKVSSPL